MSTQYKSGDLSRAFAATGIGFEGDTPAPDVTNGPGVWGVDAPKADPSRGPQAAAATDSAKPRRLTPDEIIRQLDANTARKDGGAADIGRMATVNAGNDERLTPQQKREKDRRFGNLIQTMQEQRKQLEHQLEWLAQWYEKQAQEAEHEAVKIREKIVQNVDKMQKNSTFIGEMDKLLKAHKNGESFDQEKLRRLLKQQGADVDDSTPMFILLREAEQMVIAVDDENAHLEIDNDILDKKASAFEQKAEAYRTKAAEIHTKIEGLKSQNLSDEDYNQKAEEIWEGTPLRVREEYENIYGDSAIDEKAEEQYRAKAQEEEVTIDPMAGFMSKKAPETLPDSNPGDPKTLLPSPGI